MEREIAPMKDLVSLWRLWRTIRRIRPDIVDAGTPKAGLLVGIAAWLARVPCRVYTLHGLRMETVAGPKRLLLNLTERIAAACSHRVFCLSPSLRDRVVAFNLVSPDKTQLLKSGGFGVDPEQFSPSGGSAEVENLRHRLGIPNDVPVIGFVGRFVKDKGVQQLLEAFDQLRQSYPDLRLLMVGEFEEGDRVKTGLRQYIENTPAIVRPGFVSDPALYFRLMDVLVLPTHREGFGQVSAEAQASGVPVVTTTATGAIDSVIDEVTGLLVPAGDSNALAAAIGRLLADDALRADMGRAGRKWMESDFRPQDVRNHRVQLYRDLVDQINSCTGRRKRHFDEHAEVETAREKKTGEGTSGEGYGAEADARMEGVAREQYEKVSHSANSQRCSHQPLTRAHIINRWTKGVFDVVAAVCALVIIFPFLLLVALLVRIFLGAPIFFRQDRPGFKGQLFTYVKFRTMTDARGAGGELLPDAQRLTPFGNFLRKTSIDELPGLINVVRGEMSLVGPRPLLPQYLNRYTPEQMRRHEIKPGITGWVQVNGRNSLDWEQKFALDIWYVDHQSFWLDLMILARTVKLVLGRNGISQPGHATMPEFCGAALPKAVESMTSLASQAQQEWR
jgi:lipopolysaccharide/colanic/teichoic acid biosynthesis glycosyltransferase/glycosyltransferase involved in cell wall biosynthesis